MAKRLSSVRRGIQYQDLVAAEALLDMVFHDQEVPLWVMLENRAGGAFDDVVVGYPDRVVWKQVKWAANPGAEPLTMDSLTEVDSRRKTALIAGFAESYRQITQRGESIQLELVTNRSADSEFQRLLTGSTSTIKTRLTKAQRQQLDSRWRSLTGLSTNDFATFLRTLHFLVNSPDCETRKRHVQRVLNQAGCGDDGFRRLADAIREWSANDAKERLIREDVEAVLGAGVPVVPGNDFQLPEKRVGRMEAHQELVRRINALDCGYFVVLGSPGSGKSTILNTLRSESVFPTTNDLIVYKCFTGTSDSFVRTRARADNFARFLATELYRLYTFQFGRLIDVDVGNVEKVLARAANCVGDRRRLVVVIDGIDYARRFSQSNVTGLIDSLPVSPPRGVLIVVSAQVAEQLPTHLQQLEQSRILRVPPLDSQKVRDLLKQYDVIGNGHMQPYEEDDLCRQVMGITGGHALQVSYVTRQLAQWMVRGIGLSDALSGIAPFDGDMEKYYQTILTRPNAALARQALSVMAHSPCELTAAEISGLLTPPAESRQVEDALDEYSFLLQRTGRFLHFSHDSLRAYALKQFSTGGFDAVAQVAFLSRLDRDPRIGEHLLHLLAENGSSSTVLDKVDCDWVAEQIVVGANTSLIHEGLRDLALAAVDREDWRAVARWWGLKGCLERAEFEGELYEANLVDAWLAMGSIESVERYIFVGSQFLSRIYPGPGLIDLLRSYGHYELAGRLEERTLAQSSPQVGGIGPDFEFEEYVRHLARRASPEEVVATIHKRLSGVEEIQPSHLGSFRPPHHRPEHYAKIAAYSCLNADDFDRVEAWLRQQPLPVEDITAWDLWLRMRIACKDLAEHRQKAVTALSVVEDRELLVDALSVGGFEEAVGQAIGEFNLAAAPATGYPWYDYGLASRLIQDLHADSWLCSRLGLHARMRQTESLIGQQSVRVAKAFQRAIVAIAKDTAQTPPRWKTGTDALIGEIQNLCRLKYAVDDVQGAQFFVYELGHVLEAAALAARDAGETSEFERMIEDRLLPALAAARIHYESGLVSICDMLLTVGISQGLVSRLLNRVEKDYGESWSFKSGALMGLSGRYSRIGDLESARRVLAAGARGAFTYGYRKDTIINEFISALEAVGAHLADGLREVAEFLAKALILLDSLTDGRMLYSTPAHFLAVVCKFDKSLAVRLAGILHEKCRHNLRGVLVSPAFKNHGIDAQTIREVFRQASGDLDLSTEEDEDSGDEFVVSDGTLDTKIPSLQSQLVGYIAASSYGKAFHTFPALIRALITRGDTRAAVAVFEEFEHAVRELFACYPL